jgi:Spy/CpxP family protein refolding chaperone
MLPISKLYAISLLAAVGVAGFAAGAATMSRAETGRRGARDYSYSAQLAEQLGLTQVQQDSIHAIMRSHRAEMQAIIAPVKDRLDSVRTQAREEIKALLTSDQRARYEEMIARDRARWDSAAASRGTRTGTR